MKTQCTNCGDWFFTEELEGAEFGSGEDGGDVISYTCPSCEAKVRETSIFKR